MRRTKEEAEQTKQKLLDVGVSVFTEKGYSNTRLEDIAQAAGVTRGAIYHHFKNKTEILVQITELHKEKINKMADDIIAEESDTPINGIKRIFLSLIEKLEQDDIFRSAVAIVHHKAFHDESDLIMKIQHREREEGVKKLVDFIEKGKADKKINPAVNSEALALSIILQLVGMIHLFISAKNFTRIKEMLPEMTETLVCAARVSD